MIFGKRSVHSVFIDYPINEMFGFDGQENFTIDGTWVELVEKLSLNLDIYLNSTCNFVDSENNKVYINDDVYEYENLFICANKYGIQMIEGLDVLTNLLDNIIPVEFMRIYTYHENGHNLENNLKTITSLDKIFIIDEKNLLTAYTDTEKAINMLKYLNLDQTELDSSGENNFKIIKLDEYKLRNLNIILNNLGIKSSDSGLLCHWKVGIHQYLKFQNNDVKYGNIYLAGEMVSYKQGWMEGALESVDYLINTFF